MYGILIKTKVQPTCISKWNEELGQQLGKKDWNIIFSTPFEITRDSNMQWFQYRIIHRIIGTKSFLFHINFIDNSNCFL